MLPFALGMNMAGAPSEAQLTQFPNVDLDIYSRSSLKPLVEYLGKRVLVLYEGRDRGRYVARLELSKPTKSADATVRGLCSIISSLPDEVRTSWDRATTRDFSIGIRAGGASPSCDFVLQSNTNQGGGGVAWKGRPHGVPACCRVVTRNAVYGPQSSDSCYTPGRCGESVRFRHLHGACSCSRWRWWR
jgi:hypothetical protein